MALVPLEDVPFDLPRLRARGQARGALERGEGRGAGFRREGRGVDGGSALLPSLGGGGR